MKYHFPNAQQYNSDAFWISVEKGKRNWFSNIISGFSELASSRVF